MADTIPDAAAVQAAIEEAKKLLSYCYSFGGGTQDLHYRALKCLSVFADACEHYQREITDTNDELRIAYHAYEGVQKQLAAALTRERGLREALVDAACILEALGASVVWELAPEVIQQINEVLPKLRAALAAETTHPKGT